jgi:hypothetical protein
MGNMCRRSVDTVARFFSPKTAREKKVAKGVLQKALRSSRSGQVIESALSHLSRENSEKLLLELMETLTTEAKDWLKRQNLKLKLNRRHSPVIWVRQIFQSASERSGGIVEQHIIGAKLARRFPALSVPNCPAHTPDRKTASSSDFTMGKTVYHVTAMPSRSVIKKCAANVKAGLLPVLLVPGDQEYKAKGLAEDGGIDKALVIMSIEAFVALNVIQMATEEEKDPFTILKEIVEIYNRRLGEVETDLSLQIEVR